MTPNALFVGGIDVNVRFVETAKMLFIYFSQMHLRSQYLESFCLILYVSSDLQVNENEMAEMFSFYGSVKEVKIITYRGGICKG